MTQSAAAVDRPRKLWLVIPTYNDTVRLARFLPLLCAEVERAPVLIELQVVDDGSAPDQRKALEELIAETRTRFDFVRPAISMERNEGKGAAILRGWEAAEGADWLGFLDADGAVPAAEVSRVAGMLADGLANESAIFASRIKMRGRTVERSFKRHLAGRVFASIVGAWIDPGVYDSQCGFKVIPAGTFKTIKPHLREKGFAFDVELLALLNHFKTPVIEVPVDWFDIPGSKVAMIRDSARMFRAVRTIRDRIRNAFGS